MLEVDQIHTYYGQSHVLHGVSLRVNRGACVSLLGRNGGGKTTILKSILGYNPARRGRIVLNDLDITRERTFRIVKRGVGYVPEDRGVLPSLTVDENLRVAEMGSRSRAGPYSRQKIYHMFPRLGERKDNYGNQLSGGEQQMLAIGRALLCNPELIVLDEPTEGLAPVIVDVLVARLEEIKASGISLLLVEQNYRVAMALADYVYVLGQGCVKFEGRPDELSDNEMVKRVHLGV